MKYTTNKENLEKIRAIKVFIGTTISIFVASTFTKFSVSTMSLTVFLLLMMSPTISGSRKYFKKRLMANIFALFVTEIVRYVLHGNMYGIPIVYLIILISNDVFNLKGKISVISSGAATMIFYLSIDSSSITGRFVSIIIGSIIAIIINELILPINYGKIVEKSIKDLCEKLLDLEDLFLSNNGNFNENIIDINKYIRGLSSDLIALEEELEVDIISKDIKKYNSKIKEYRNIEKILIGANDYICTLYNFRDYFKKLGTEEKEYIINATNLLHSEFKKRYLSFSSDEKIINNPVDLKVHLDKFNFKEKESIIIASKLIEYSNTFEC